MGTTGPPGAEEAGGCPSVLGGGGVPRRVLSCPGLVAGPSRHEEARTAGSNLTKAQDGVPEFFFFFPQLLHGWAIRSKGKAFPKSQLDGAGRRRRVFFPPSSLWKIRLRRWRGKEAVRGLQDQDQDPQLMDRGLRLLALPAALASSQVGSPPGVATPASTYSRTVGGWGGHGCPGNAGEPTGLGRQELPSLLSPRARATPALPELGWLSSSRLSAVGQEGSWG